MMLKCLCLGLYTGLPKFIPSTAQAESKASQTAWHPALTCTILTGWKLHVGGLERDHGW